MTADAVLVFACNVLIEKDQA